MKEFITVIVGHKRVKRTVLNRIRCKGMNDIVVVRYNYKKYNLAPFRGPDGKELVRLVLNDKAGIAIPASSKNNT